MTLFNVGNIVAEIYEACNKFRWFTHGTTEEYNEMFDFIRKHADFDKLTPDEQEDFSFNWFCKQITDRIAEHTTPDRNDKESIMFNVVRAIAPHYFNYKY